MWVDGLLVIKEPGQCKQCRRNNHIFEKFWEKFDRPKLAQLVDTDTPLPDDITYAPDPSTTHTGTSGSPTVALVQEEYDRLRQFEFFQNN